MKITKGAKKETESSERNNKFSALRFFNAISAGYLSAKTKNSLEWLLVMGVTKRCRMAEIRKRISKMEDS
ncbi:hypothetical protein V1951_20645 [Yersinia sp. 2544 StPb PI]|uniref:hypothetical protein n=1 Tax=unclassified Yersinia (in: enterobacteria) TaxID=2653513 RepID=UPI001D0F7AA4